MSQTAEIPTPGKSNKNFWPFLWLLPLAPWGAVYLWQSWQLPAFRYIPLLLVVCGWLLWNRYQLSRPSFSGWLGNVVGVFGFLIGLAGAFANSPWLVWVGLVGMSAVFLGRWRSVEYGHPAWPVWLLLCLSIRPPGKLATQMVGGLQSLSTKLASALLDLLGIVHHRAGNVIELPDRRFMVEEACSGVQSLYTLVFVGACLAVFYRRSITQGLALVLAAGVWAAGMNVLRILIVILGHAWAQRDWTHGWQHELVGYFALLVAIGLLVSTDRLVFLVSGPICEEPQDVHVDRVLNPFIVAYNRIVGGGVGPWFHRPAPVFSDARNLAADTIPLRVKGLVLFATCSLLLLGIPTAWGFHHVSVQPQVRELAFTEESVAPELMGWRVAGFEIERRAAEDAFGEYSAVWTMNRGSFSSRVSLDYYFSGWHDLQLCYQGIGWEVMRRRVGSGRELLAPSGQGIDTSSGSDWDFVEIVMRDQTGNQALLLYSLCELDGTPALSTTDSAWWLLLQKLLWAGEAPVTVQMQVFVPTASEPTESLKRDAYQLLGASRALLRQQVVQQVGGR